MVGVKNYRRWGVALVGLLLMFVGLAVLIPRYGLQKVGTAVMEPTIRHGVTVIVDEKTPIDRGDLVVVEAWGGNDFVVRVVGVGGDVIACCEGGRLLVNGSPLQEPYAHGDTAAFGEFSVTVPQGRIFVLGEARDISVDSRSHLDQDGGTVAVERARGQVVAVASPLWRIWPLAGIGDLPMLLTGVLSMAGGLAALIIAGWSPLRRAALAFRHRISTNLLAFLHRRLSKRSAGERHEDLGPDESARGDRENQQVAAVPGQGDGRSGPQ